MVAALEQSGGAWLPSVHAETDVEEAARAAAPAARYLLDAAGGRFEAAAAQAGAAVVLGPEGGMLPAERARFTAAGWRPVRIAATILRFETAGIAALAILRAAHTPLAEGADG
jgi:16S rRNA (uracil1498-N3)-methyltransferase